MTKWVWPSINVLCLNLHIDPKHAPNQTWMQNNQLPTKSPVELKDNSNVWCLGLFKLLYCQKGLFSWDVVRESQYWWFCGQIAVAVGLIAAGVAITLSTVVWRAAFVAFALLAFAAAYACSQGVLALTQNYVRPHRKWDCHCTICNSHTHILERICFWMCVFS